MAKPASDPASAGELTALLGLWRDGDPAAFTDIISLAYDDLRAIAGGYLRRERAGHTLQATALINELYIRLARQKTVPATSREHFYAFAALMMRRILTDHARRAAAQKRPGVSERVPLHEELAWVDASSDEMLALDEAITALAALAPRAARCLDLRVFLGSTVEEAGEILGISKSTVSREVDFAAAWLYRRMHTGR